LGASTTRPVAEAVGEREGHSPLALALYDHQDAGTCWEKHGDAKLREAGLVPSVNWAGRYRHKALPALSVYVDDFKPAYHPNDEKKAWKPRQGKIKLKKPAPPKLHVGCNHRLHRRRIGLRGLGSGGLAARTGTRR
jgi:hypothetical protein